MNRPDNQRRRRRGRAAHPQPGSTGVLDADPLAELRAALRQHDPEAFARCFSVNGWLRVPRPEGDIVFREPSEIAQAGRDLRSMLAELSWTPTQRFLSAGQVVEEAVVRARTVDASGPAGGEIQISMRVVTALDSLGGIGSLTLWIDWAALRDPLGVDSARGAASALVALARARDVRGLQVIEGGSGPDDELVIPAPEPPARPERSARPPAPVLWWQQHRGTVAGTVMAVLAIAVLGWVGQNVLQPAVHSGRATLGAATEAPTPTGGPSTATATPTVKSTKVPVIRTERPSAKPTVQAGKQYVLQSDVLFETGSTRLSKAAQTKLTNLAKVVQANNVNGTIQINGYTDNVGSTQLNLDLSRARATAVAEALQPFLIGSPVILTPQAFGESDPTASNATSRGRASNRRVTIVLPSKSLTHR
jgi:outer membrane protein OmpA-like peptidoglycan-associated protein